MKLRRRLAGVLLVKTALLLLLWAAFVRDGRVPVDDEAAARHLLNTTAGTR